MKSSIKQNAFFILKYLKIILWILLIAIVSIGMLFFDLDMDTLLGYLPSRSLFTAIALWVLFAIKSVTFVFPLMVLEIITSYIFPATQAILINLIGILINLILPYMIGNRYSPEKFQRILEKYPKFKAVVDNQKGSSWCFCYVIHILPFIPSNIATMYLGVIRVSCYKALLGGTCGLLPTMLLAVLFGASIQNKGSVGYWLAITLKILISVTVTTLYVIQTKRKTKAKSERS